MRTEIRKYPSLFVLLRKLQRLAMHSKKIIITDNFFKTKQLIELDRGEINIDKNKNKKYDGSVDKTLPKKTD